MKKLGFNLTTLGIAITLLVVICCCAYFGMSALSTDEPNTPEEYAKEYQGNVEVYREILSSNDCTYLQQQFETAFNSSENSEPGTVYHIRATGFMKASDARMKEIGCYK
jgi:Na+-transporting methylmalonyl-CoA/oxaloacetate decarboxylase gamma subunit